MTTGSYLEAGRTKVLLVTLGLTALIAFLDWSVGNTISLGVLYIFPMMLGALVMRWPGTALLALLCAFLRSRFDVPSSQVEAALRFAFASLSYFVSGLFVMAVVRNRRQVADHLAKIQQEQELRREAEEQLRVLVASSPAAILTVDHRGVVLAANRAADTLFAMPEGQTLQGRTIGSYLPVLLDALSLRNIPEDFRTAAQCQGRRENDEIFLANTWFSSYAAPEGARLAAIVVDSSEEMRDREEQNLRQLLESNRITAAAVSHELRNFCGAISLVCSNLKHKQGFQSDEDFQGLANLVDGLEKITALELNSLAKEQVEETALQPVLDSLRIVIDAEWKEIDGAVRWHLPHKLPPVMADPHGLLQALLNLASNSHRAVRESPLRELDIAVTVMDGRASIRFEDSGPGISNPERLFQPFQQGADGSGLGLYVSRAVVRSYGGELRFEPRAEGSCFVVELQVS
jgi:two-component system, LuxR family, sensor kinase FixL